MKVYITRIIPAAGLELIRAAGHEIVEYTGKTALGRDEFYRHASDADGLLLAGSSPLSREVMDSLPKLKVISLMSVGYDHVDLAAAAEKGIRVGHTPGVLSDATADVAFLLMLAASRKAFYLHKQIARGGWGFFEPTENLGLNLKGKTIGIFGLGSIGYEMARRCRGAYDMQILYHNRGRNELAERELHARKVSFEELLAQSDVLSLHSTLTDETKGLFDRKAFEQMKPTSIFVNAGRGGLHNEADLLEALNNGTIWGAGLDVTNPEPMTPDNPLLEMPNVAILPHIGSATIDTRDAMAVLAAQNLLAGLDGTPLPSEVPPPAGS